MPHYFWKEQSKLDGLLIGSTLKYSNYNLQSVLVDELETNFMSLAILFHLLCAQHISDINISIFRSLRLC